jgi:EAL domain-containing protein (putative c-di-GMP-specific phosphodiesterase class I)
LRAYIARHAKALCGHHIDGDWLLRLTLVAEGVETEEQAKILRLLRCDQMQGYLISKPLAFEAMTDYLKSARR